MVKLEFLIFLLICKSSWAEDLIKLELDSSYVVNTLSNYYYFEPKEGYNFIQIKFESYLLDFFMYHRFYEHKNLDEIKKNLPTYRNYEKANYYFDDTQYYAIAYYKYNPNIRTICFETSSNYDIFYSKKVEIKVGHTFDIKENKEYYFDNVFLNVFPINRTELSITGDSIGFYSENKELTSVNAFSKSCSKVKGHLFLVTPSTDEYYTFIIIDSIDSPIHLQVKIFPDAQYKIYSWTSKSVYFDISKEDCQKTILGIENVEKSRYANATIDFLKGYGDINMYLSYDIGKNYTFDELIDSAKTSIFDHIITNKDINFYNIKCSIDSYMKIESVYAKNNESYLYNLPMKITYLEKGKNVKYIFKANISDEYDFLITIFNKKILEKGDINIISDYKNISMVENPMYFHHEPGESFFMIENLKYNVILNITLEVNFELKYIFNDTIPKTEITDKNDFHILVKPKILEPISSYKQIFHNVYTEKVYKSSSQIHKIYITQNFIRKYINHLPSSSAQLILDNEIIRNHEKYNPADPTYFYFYLQNVEDYDDFSIEYFYSGKADLKRAQFFHANDSRIEQTLFDIEPKDNDTDMLSFFIFACGKELDPHLSINYSSTNIIGYTEYKSDYKFFYLNYNLENIKGKGSFKGNFMIFYNLYKKPDFDIKVNYFQIELASYNFLQKEISINIYPYLSNDEVEYEIYYAKIGEIPSLSKCQAFHWFEEYKQKENENIHLKIVNFNKSDKNPFEVKLDYSMDKWPNYEITYDILIFIKQVNYQKNRDIYRTNIKQIIKYDISSLVPFEKEIETYEESILLYDAEKINYENEFYYLYFDQDISFDSINIICTATTYESKKSSPNLNTNDCQVFQEPGSTNSFILSVGKISKSYSSYYNTITIQKKKEFHNNLKFNIIKKKKSLLESKIYSIKTEDNYPLIFCISGYNSILRKMNGDFDFFYVQKSLNSIAVDTKFKKDKYVLWDSGYKTITIIINLKDVKIGESITFEFWEFNQICESRQPQIKIVKSDLSNILFSDTNLIQMNIYKDDEHKNRVMNVKNIFFETEQTKYYIINEDNIPKNESITKQCFISKDIFLLNDKYFRTNNSYEIIYNTQTEHSLEKIEYFMELKDYDLDYNKEYRFLISKNNFSEFNFVNIYDIFNIVIKQFSKSKLTISLGNETYFLIDKNILKLEHKNGEKSIRIENEGNEEDSCIIIILYSKESENMKVFSFNSYQKMIKSDYGFIKFDKEDKDKILRIFPYYNNNFNLYYTFSIFDSELKYIPNYTFMKNSNSLSLYLNKFNYNSLLNEENFNLIFNIDKENMIFSFIGEKIYNEDVNKTIKTEKNQNILVEFKTQPKAVQVIPCNNEKINITLYSWAEAINHSNISNSIVFKMDSQYLNIFGKSYICSDSKYLTLNSNYNSTLNVVDYNKTHLRIQFVPIQVVGLYIYYIIQYNSSSIFAKDSCQAYDNFKEKDYSQIKIISNFVYYNKNSFKYIEKKKLNPNDEYINIIVRISDYFYAFYQPIKLEINFDVGESQSFGIILGILIPIIIIVFLMLGFIGFRYYKKKKNSQVNNLVNDIQNMSGMEKELL